MNSLLDEPIFQMRTGTSVHGESLPGVLHGLCQNAEVAFPRLRPHQEHTWFMFLAQLGALALESHPQPPATPADPRWRGLDVGWWRAALVELSGGDERAWHLVAPLEAPAFLQPPVPDGTLERFNDPYFAADELDLLVTAKNHDLKTRRHRSGSAEDWVHALVSLQTGEGYGGRGNHGVMRMNGGLGNRPYVAVNTSSSWSVRFKEDVARMLGGLDAAAERMQTTANVRLVGLDPWSGESSLAVNVLHPYAVEVCRRVRLTFGDSRWAAHTVASDKPRIDAKELRGNVSDPWSPLVAEEDGVKSLTVSGGGLTYKLIRDVLFNYQRPVSLSAIPGAAAGPRVLHLTALVRGQGKTEGLHRRAVPIPTRAAFALFENPTEMVWAERAESQIKDAADVQSRCLRPAIRTLLDGGEMSSRPKDPRADRWTEAFQRSVDAVFFEHLFRDVGPEVAFGSWRSTLRAAALAQIDAACKGAPIPAARRHKAIANARSLFHGSFRKHFPNTVESTELFPQPALPVA